MESDEHEHDEAEECRICRGGRDIGPLLHPCKCSGSIRYVHEECIKLWLQRTRQGTKNCELCHHPFKFSPVYRDDTPSRLPPVTFFIGFLRIAWKHILLLLRLVRMRWKLLYLLLFARFAIIMLQLTWKN